MLLSSRGSGLMVFWLVGRESWEEWVNRIPPIRPSPVCFPHYWLDGMVMRWKVHVNQVSWLWRRFLFVHKFLNVVQKKTWASFNISVKRKPAVSQTTRHHWRADFLNSTNERKIKLLICFLWYFNIHPSIMATADCRISNVEALWKWEIFEHVPTRTQTQTFLTLKEIPNTGGASTSNLANPVYSTILSWITCNHHYHLFPLLHLFLSLKPFFCQTYHNTRNVFIHWFHLSPKKVGIDFFFSSFRVICWDQI